MSTTMIIAIQLAFMSIGMAVCVGCVITFALLIADKVCRVIRKRKCRKEYMRENNRTVH